MEGRSDRVRTIISAAEPDIIVNTEVDFASVSIVRSGHAVLSLLKVFYSSSPSGVQVVSNRLNIAQVGVLRGALTVLPVPGSAWSVAVRHLKGSEATKGAMR